MYNLALFENGIPCTVIGGPLRTIGECLTQISALTKSVDVTDIDGFVGCKWDRHGTECWLVATTELGTPVRETKSEKEG